MPKKIMPSVTRILKDMGLIDLGGIPLETLETKRQLGVSVHSLCSMLAVGRKVDLGKLQGPLRDRAERFLWFMDFMGAKALSTEQRYTAESPFPYTGRYDLLMRAGDLNWLIDIKPTYHTWNRLQLAAYETLLFAHSVQVDVRAVLPLDSSKHPKVVLCQDNSDLREWQRCLDSWHWRKRNGLLKAEV